MTTHSIFRYAWILLLALAACSPAPQAPGAPEAIPSPAGDWTIKLTQTGGFAGVKLNVQVTSDGRLTADDQKTGRSASQTLPPETVARIASQAAPLLGSTSPAPRAGCADCFLYTIEFTSDGKTTRLEADDTTLSDSGAGSLVKLLQQLRDQALRATP